MNKFSIALLVLRPDRPSLDRKAKAALQDAHMAHLADLHEAGYTCSQPVRFSEIRMKLFEG